MVGTAAVGNALAVAGSGISVAAAAKAFGWHFEWRSNQRPGRLVKSPPVSIGEKADVTVSAGGAATREE